MKKLFLIIFLLNVGLSNIYATDIPDTPGNRQAAAERYLAITPMDSMMKDMIGKMAKNLPAEQRKEFVKIMTEDLRIDVLERAAISSIVRNFTLREINALVDFYGSPEGQSTIKKMGAYMADIMPVMEQEIMRSIQQHKSAQ